MIVTTGVLVSLNVRSELRRKNIREVGARPGCRGDGVDDSNLGQAFFEDIPKMEDGRLILGVAGAVAQLLAIWALLYFTVRYRRERER